MLTDESLCRNVTNAQYWVRDRLILAFFHYYVLTFMWTIPYSCLTVFLDENEKSKFQKPLCCAFWKKILIFAYFSIFFIRFFRNISILSYIFSIFMLSWLSKTENKYCKSFTTRLILEKKKTHFSNFLHYFSKKLT